MILLAKSKTGYVAQDSILVLSQICQEAKIESWATGQFANSIWKVPSIEQKHLFTDRRGFLTPPKW